MTKSDPSALIAAATAFDDELETYARLGDLFLRSPTSTLKQLERANSILGDLAQSEQRLQESGQQLIVALAAARERQQQLSKSVIDHAPSLQGRNERLQSLMAALHELATNVAKLNQVVIEGEGQDGAPTPEEVSGVVLALSKRAEEAAEAARAAGFAELAEQAHALHQRLQAIATKLQRAAN